MPISKLIVTREAVVSQIIDLIQNDIQAPGLTADSSLQSEGLDSLMVMSLVFKIEDHYGVILNEEDADDLRTVGDLADLFLRRLGQQS